MYIPAEFLNTNQEEAVAFMQQHSFAILSTILDQEIQASHLPFVIKIADEKTFLYTHFAKVNPLAQLQNGANCTILFSGPHAYISPSLYSHARNVPTWNYQALHAKGIVTRLETADEMESLMQDLFAQYEPAYKAPYTTLDQSYKDGLMRAILAIKIEIIQIDFAEKLSQNKTDAEQRKIGETLSAAGNSMGEVILGKLDKKLSAHL